jgi:hypothetical protein
MPGPLLVGLALQAAAIVGLAALVPVSDWPALLGPAGVAAYLAVPAIGCALSAWGVRSLPGSFARAASILFGAPPLVGLVTFIDNDAEAATTGIVCAAVLAALGWVLLPWIARERRAASVALSVGGVALVLGMPLLGLVAGVEIALTRRDGGAAATLAVELGVASATLAVVHIAALRRQLAPRLRVLDDATRLLRLARVADLCAVGVAVAAPIAGIVDAHIADGIPGAAGAALFLTVSILARAAARRRSQPALPTAISRRAAR